MNRQHFQWNEPTMGVCYYPEQWPREMWASDLERMKDAGISIVRVGEFAWAIFEPEEGRFSFEFFDDFLALCLEKDMHVILGTPTATPPAWLTEKYPEVLNASKQGVLYRHGSRRHYNYSSETYQRLCARLVEQLAAHYGPHPMVVGWQIDNELNCEVDEFYSDADHRAFRSFLKLRYPSLDALNRAWGTVYWSQTYTDWEQVYAPRPVLSNATNPHQLLDYYRFISDNAIRFAGMQAEIIRRYRKPVDFITTNGMFGNLDHARLCRESLDVFTYDYYPNMSFMLGTNPRTDRGLNDRGGSRYLTDVRGVCPHFGIMEQQTGASGWINAMEAPAPRPGQLELWAMQSVAQGADYISFFRWRSVTFGVEQYWHGILDYDNRDNRKLAEVREFHRKFRKLTPLCGAKNIAAFALLKDYDNTCDARLDTWHSRIQQYSEAEIFAASELCHTPYDTIFLSDDTMPADLLRYPVIFYPHPFMIDQRRVDLLKEYVHRGGTLIVGCRAGVKDTDGHCVTLPQPGLLGVLTGTEIMERTMEHPMEQPSFAMWGAQRLDTPIFNDVLTPLEGTKVLARYGSSYYEGQAALTEKSLGNGRTLHLGSPFTREGMKLLFSYTGILEPFDEYVEAPAEIEVTMREKEGRRYLFCLNFQPVPHQITLRRGATLLYTGKKAEGTIELPAYGTAVFAFD